MNRTLLTFIILTVLAFLSVLLPYGCAFSTHISENSQDWANFGSYVGGTLSPIIATLASYFRNTNTEFGPWYPDQ
jgi:hypothetical protein